MSTGQWRVFGLIMLLLGLEVLRNPNVKAFMQALLVTPFQQASQ